MSSCEPSCINPAASHEDNNTSSVKSSQFCSVICPVGSATLFAFFLSSPASTPATKPMMRMIVRLHKPSRFPLKEPIPVPSPIDFCAEPIPLPKFESREEPVPFPNFRVNKLPIPVPKSNTLSSSNQGLSRLWRGNLC